MNHVGLIRIKRFYKLRGDAVYGKGGLFDALRDYYLVAPRIDLYLVAEAFHYPEASPAFAHVVRVGVARSQDLLVTQPVIIVSKAFIFNCYAQFILFRDICADPDRLAFVLLVPMHDCIDEKLVEYDLQIENRAVSELTANALQAAQQAIHHNTDTIYITRYNAFVNVKTLQTVPRPQIS